jgi:hypothetical protein
MLTAQISAPQLGSVIDDIGTISKQVQPYLDVIKLVLADPALPTVVGQIRTISNLPSAPLGPTIPGQPVVKPPGIGLSAVVGPIDAFIWGKRHPVAVWLIGAAAVALPIGMGVVIGRVSKRCRVSK